MSTNEVSNNEATEKHERRQSRHETRSGHHPRLECRSRQGILRKAGVAARCRSRSGQRFPSGPVHASWFRQLNSIRCEPHIGRARFGPGNALGRHRYRSGAPATR
jgi:hypothetical protein